MGEQQLTQLWKVFGDVCNTELAEYFAASGNTNASIISLIMLMGLACVAQVKVPTADNPDVTVAVPESLTQFVRK